MKFKHLKRNGILFVLSNFITLGIVEAVVLYHVGQELNFMAAKHEDKKSMNFVACWLIGWITLGIVPIVWYCRAADKVNKYANEIEIDSPKVNFEIMFNWSIFGFLIIVGPFIAWSKFFRRLNALEARLNEEALKADVIEEPVAEAVPEVVEEVPVEEAAAEVPVEEAAAPEQEEEIRIICKEKEGNPGRKWRVRYASSEKAVVEFNSKEEAIEYARYLASKRSHKVVVINRKK